MHGIRWLLLLALLRGADEAEDLARQEKMLQARSRVLMDPMGAWLEMFKSVAPEKRALPKSATLEREKYEHALLYFNTGGTPHERRFSAGCDPRPDVASTTKPTLNTSSRKPELLNGKNFNPQEDHSAKATTDSTQTHVAVWSGRRGLVSGLNGSVRTPTNATSLINFGAIRTDSVYR
eukprot:CAMPEP_0175926228 /NCGR_PEP_ID=MMETSP0108-20121206/16067_1 /TAXON_ID=195067 ORGANISM="Goniomonas pacifica, Strain CCMP1869" /NCGR_SAMPLE_ID=MMETSP0108 /ASSEMBLY_ACC=CAM_ASM_000204 /LENGTH=177 /DNA_ID=CAMNT_0017249431 /DNA_START=48 /DNA_END=579 /DNA_ORIENTATION=+